ncbi:MAG TPA: glutathione synthase [Gemmatimonadota bacterium]|nr:glutathione synthase [Gemmatimonadota bacterium]
MKHRLELLFIIDPLDVLILETETTLLLIAESRHRGHDCHVAHARDLYLRDREPRVRAREIEIDEALRPFYRLGPRLDRPLESFSVVLMRKDPPVDLAYHNALTILEPAREKVPVINDPVGIRRSNEKLLPLEIPGAAAPSVVTADKEVIAAFAREHEEVVVKPLNEFSGRGITRLSLRESTLDADAVGALAAHHGRHVLVQRFLPEVARGDKRVFVLEGEPLGWVNRIPRPGSFRANIHQGAAVEATELTDREREVIRAARPLLAERGLEVTGFDFIGPFLTEINVTSPSAVRQINRVMGIHLEAPLVDWLERRAAGGVGSPLPE